MSIRIRKDHWNHIHRTKAPDEVSWYQATPETSLGFFRELNIPLTASIIDIGGGGSRLVDNLLDLGFRDITVLDISEAAIDQTKQRLGDQAELVKWIVADVTHFNPDAIYDVWHDRATFHFLTSDEEIAAYLAIPRQSIVRDGIMVIGTFSEAGPDTCSGLEVRRYSEESLAARLEPGFERIRCLTVDHVTPSGSVQNFLFCGFRRRID
jgi:SAM-dependent methyltransferase